MFIILLWLFSQLNFQLDLLIFQHLFIHVRLSSCNLEVYSFHGECYSGTMLAEGFPKQYLSMNPCTCKPRRQRFCFNRPNDRTTNTPSLRLSHVCHSSYLAGLLCGKTAQTASLSQSPFPVRAAVWWLSLSFFVHATKSKHSGLTKWFLATSIKLGISLKFSQCPTI